MVNYNHIKYFHDALRLGSLTASAKANRVSLSAVSQAIAALEETLGTALLVHGKNRLIPTPQGRLLREKCVNVFAAVEKLFVEIREVTDGDAGQIRLAASHSLFNSVLPRFLHNYQRNHPKIDLSFFVGDGVKVRDLISSREIDVGLVVETRSGDKPTPGTLHSGSFVFVARAKDKREHYENLILGDKGVEVIGIREQLRKAKGGPYKRLIPTQSWEVIASLAATGLGIGYVPDFLAVENKELKVLESTLETSHYDIILHATEVVEYSRSMSGFVENFTDFCKKM
ncbi:MAG: LysR family transcriptional regulator [Pseudomonadota bacterium]